MAFWNRKPKIRSEDNSEPNNTQTMAIQISLGDVGMPGYVKLSEHPDVMIAVDKIADLVSSMTIHLVENTDKGDRRVRNELARKIDIEPCRHMTRKTWIYKIVRDMLLDGDGNSILHIGVDQETGLLKNLTPFQMPSVGYNEGKTMMDYSINYDGVVYQPDEVVHFVLNPHPYYPYRGTGYRVALRDIVKGLSQANKTKENFMSGKYMPTLILAVDAMTEEMGTKDGREAILKKYVDETEGGKPWVIPAELINVHQVKPLSLKDIAIIEGMEIDKKTIAGLIGVPAFFLGVGEFKKEEYNNFINSRIMSIGQRIAQTLTRDLLYNPNWFFRLNPRSLYSYDLKELVEAGSAMVDRIAMRRNELRDWIGLDPDQDMEELIALENYIPSSMLGQQNKLKGGETGE